MRIAIDIDDTITSVDRVTAVEKYLQDNALSFRFINVDSHTLSGLLNWSKEDVTTFIHSGGAELFTKAAARKGAKEVVDKWKKAGHEIIILTARSTEWFGDPVGVSRGQLDENGIPYDEVVADVWEKGAYCREHGIEVLIEDNFEICKKAQDLGVKAVLFVDEHNGDRAKEITYAGSSWEQIDSVVERIAKQ